MGSSVTSALFCVGSLVPSLLGESKLSLLSSNEHHFITATPRPGNCHLQSPVSIIISFLVTTACEKKRPAWLLQPRKPSFQGQGVPTGSERQEMSELPNDSDSKARLSAHPLSLCGHLCPFTAGPVVDIHKDGLVLLQSRCRNASCDVSVVLGSHSAV